MVGTYKQLQNIKMMSKHLIVNNKTFNQQFYSTDHSTSDEYPLTQLRNIPLSRLELLVGISFKKIDVKLSRGVGPGMPETLIGGCGAL
jgi:hypothetical protein